MTLRERNFVRLSYRSVSLLLGLLLLASCIGVTGLGWQSIPENQEPEDQTPPRVGHANFESPHAKPIAAHPDGQRVYVVNTPADTVDVLDTKSFEVIDRIHVGIDPVSIRIRTDGLEVWVSNHVSDSISVIDSDSSNPTFHQVLDTIQVLDSATKSTRFDEPVSIAFANDQKAYVALSSANEIAVIDVESRAVVDRLLITAQDPRAIEVVGDKLYVIPFESNNQTAVSGCLPENLGKDPLCTFDADAHVVNAPDGNAQSLSLNYVLDIVRHPQIPDRDLYVFDTETDELLQVVDTLGTLLYGIAVDSKGRVFVTQAEARNDANGKAGTEGHGLAELENRAFLNQITYVDCTGIQCTKPSFIDLEPLPPVNPEKSKALATPYGIQLTHDEQTIVATAAASHKVFTVDSATGEVLDQILVDSVPRGITLVSDKEEKTSNAWVLNALANTVSIVDVTNVDDLNLISTVALDDPTDPSLKLGRIAFNDANASSTGTFSCASCHPDGHTDQLLWVLDTPLCDVGCDQIQPRLVQDIRGLQGTAPYHWDGIPGDPFGGINTSSIESYVEPNCDIEDEESCTLQLVDSSLASTMCQQDDCEVNEEGLPGTLSKSVREAMSKYLLSVFYPPSVERGFDNSFSPLGMEGVKEFHYIKQCGNCHLLPHWTTTNMGGSGMDLPSWRGANDRWKNAPQNRFFFADFVRGDTRGFPERTSFTQSKAMYQMILEGSIGVHGAFARQLTLNERTAEREITLDLLNALETADAEEAISLQAEGLLKKEDSLFQSIRLSYNDNLYVEESSEDTYSTEELLTLAESGELLLTLVGRLGTGVDYEHPQPTLWPTGFPIRPIFPGDRPQEFPELHDSTKMRVHGDYIFEGASLYVDGRKVEGSIDCEEGELPNCKDQTIVIELEALPSESGLEISDIRILPNNAVMHLLQVQNPQGLFSNDFPFFVVQEPKQARFNSLLQGDGQFNNQGGWRANTQNGFVTFNGEAHFKIREVNERQPWRASLAHDLLVRKGLLYSICYDASSTGNRYMEVNVDTGPGGDRPYRGLMSTGLVPEVGGGVRSVGVSLGEEMRPYHHRFVADVADSTARLTFNLAQSEYDVRIDNVGVFYGKDCGEP